MMMRPPLSTPKRESCAGSRGKDTFNSIREGSLTRLLFIYIFSAAPWLSGSTKRRIKKQERHLNSNRWRRWQRSGATRRINFMCPKEKSVSRTSFALASIRSGSGKGPRVLCHPPLAGCNG